MKRFLPRFITVLASMAVVVYLASYLVDPFIRHRVEREMNQKLTHYHTRVRGAHLQFLSGTLTLRRIVIVQDAHPAPPVADLPLLRISIQWSELFSGHIVADSLLSEPHLQINLAQLRAEQSNGTPLRKEGWQDALQNIYPFKINRFRIRNGDVVYIDKDPQRPLHIEKLNFTADNIRNIHSPDNTYPSLFRADAVVFKTGHAALDGRANFLQAPFPGLRATIDLKSIPLTPFEPEVQRANFNLKGGVFDGHGLFEYSPKIARAEIYRAQVSNVNAEYFHTAQTAAAEQARVDKAKEAAQEAANQKGLFLKIDEMRMKNCNLAFTDHEKDPGYRLFITSFDATVTNLSNHMSEGDSHFDLRGRFMGSGDTVLVGAFRPEKAGPDFNLKLSIQNTDLTALNDVLRAYGRFDVAAGRLSVYSEATVQKGMMQGYVKPMFSEVEVYSKEQERGKPFLHRAYEAAIGVAATVLKNRSSQQVATDVDISGRLDNPNASTWQALGQFLRNGFIRAILPGFDRQTQGTVNDAKKTKAAS
jgi:hypothetical protein